MRHTIGPTRLSATLLTLTLTLVACGRSGGTDTEDAFCPAMEQVATRMEPSAEPTPPAEVETSFGEVVTLLDQAERTAPSELRDDVTRYATPSTTTWPRWPPSTSTSTPSSAPPKARNWPRTPPTPSLRTSSTT